jgi:predicted chitinase
MRYIEITQEQLDENWKKNLAGLGLAGLTAFSSPTNKNEPIPEPTPMVAPKQPDAPPKVEVPPVSKQAVTHAQNLLKSDHAQYLKQEAMNAGISGTQLAQFLAQCAHESQNFTRLRETGNAQYFRNRYDKRFNPANAELLGNVKNGDGERYIGRGYIHLTGRYNYTRAGRALGLDLVNHPELAERPENAAKIAIWFWQNRVQPRVNDFTDVAAVTRPINRKLIGLDDRQHKFDGLNYLIAKR